MRSLTGTPMRVLSTASWITSMTEFWPSYLPQACGPAREIPGLGCLQLAASKEYQLKTTRPHQPIFPVWDTPVVLFGPIFLYRNGPDLTETHPFSERQEELLMETLGPWGRLALCFDNDDAGRVGSLQVFETLPYIPQTAKRRRTS